MSRKQVAHRFKVVLYPEPDGSGWNAEIPAVKGCLSCGRSLAEARRMIRDALSLFEEEFDGKADEVAANAIFEEDIRLPKGVKAAVQRFEKARAKATAEAAKAAEASTAAARTITEKLSLRDAGELLGMSHQGVRKILKTG